AGGLRERHGRATVAQVGHESAVSLFRTLRKRIRRDIAVFRGCEKEVWPRPPAPPPLPARTHANTNATAKATYSASKNPLTRRTANAPVSKRALTLARHSSNC